MSTTCNIRRYAAYFRGWAQAFGEHQQLEDPDHGLRWLVGSDQVGLILEPSLRRRFFPSILGRHGQKPPPVTLTLSEQGIDLGSDRLTFGEESKPAAALALSLITGTAPLHIYQTYHLIYPSGTRILTLTARPPLAILYHEIEPLTLRLANSQGASPA